ncbi:hypothetical protein IKG41_03405 [Candidatus Saccharibacteria bacterium]|nr:hypothetical protein [Candidatus Saccharibacteria bacterium]
MKERSNKDLKPSVDAFETKEFRVGDDHISIGTGPKMKISGKDSVEIDTHTVKRDLKIHIEHSLRMPDDWIFGEINFLTFLAQVRDEPRKDGIRGDRITELHIIDPVEKIEPVAVFKHGEWLISPSPDRKAMMEILISYLTFNPVAKDSRFDYLEEKRNHEDSNKTKTK